MTRFIALLRAINVGGHVVKMDRLRRVFESLGFAGVETFIASGNVVFATRSQNTRALERRIEAALRDNLGYDVATFLRTPDQVAAVATYQAFRLTALRSAVALNVGFLSAAPGAAVKKGLIALRSEIDDFAVHGREVYWLRRKKQSESTFSNAVFEKMLGGRATWRGLNTVRRLAARYAGP